MKVLKRISTILSFLTLVLFLLLLQKNTFKYPNTIGSDSIMNYDEIRFNEYRLVEEKVKPYIVYANVFIDGVGYKGEVVEDKQNGTTYCVKVNDELFWLDSKFVTILDDEYE